MKGERNEKTKRLLGVLLVLILLVQSTSLAFAYGSNEQEEILDVAIHDSEQEVSLDTIFQKMNDEEIMRETEELHIQVQELRKQRGPVTLSQDEVAAKALAEERADIIDAIDQEVEH